MKYADQILHVSKMTHVLPMRCNYRSIQKYLFPHVPISTQPSTSPGRTTQPWADSPDGVPQPGLAVLWFVDQGCPPQTRVS